MSKRALVWMVAICGIAALVSVFVFDRAVALAVHDSGLENAAFFVQGREFLDIFTGRGMVDSHVGLGQMILGAGFILVGLIWVAVRRDSRFGRALAFAGVVQLATIEIAWLVKDWFGRLRPFQVIAHDDWNHMWFSGGSSFPSGHNAFFWGLFLPLAYAYPKLRIPLLIVPVYIALARIDENFHFLSDVLAAIALAALVTLAFASVSGRWIRPPGRRRLFADTRK
jgi:membrane-associated phospholipid phosphatase